MQAHNFLEINNAMPKYWTKAARRAGRPVPDVLYSTRLASIALQYQAITRTACASTAKRYCEIKNRKNNNVS